MDSRTKGTALAAARSWIQQHCLNGSEVIWGSAEILQPHITVEEVEEIALRVAEAVEKEVKRD